ncbi:HAD family phosphatase [Actinomyces slackii]|uniref:Phosphoglycolate phosphatase n=2 Tax=Actinomyces slackii TaxID=52774 RepID=A0A3S4WL52_9ACTO|nr:HAD family phosphatase [Actinomyces slackii]VEG75287.1 phosphoglycolate phosphatase [Actinomyces slackii]
MADATARGAAPAPSQPIEAVILDYGNVLYTWEATAAIAGRVPLETWEEFVTGADFSQWNVMSDAGTPFEEVVAALMARHPQRPDWAELLRTYRRNFAHSLTGPVPGTADVIDDLLAAGIPLYCLTNFDAPTFDGADGLVPQLARFKGVVVSGREHLVKPDPAIFDLLITRYGLSAERTLFVDDTPANIATAQALGLRTHLFTGAGRLRAELTSLGLLEPLVD